MVTRHHHVHHAPDKVLAGPIQSDQKFAALSSDLKSVIRPPRCPIPIPGEQPLKRCAKAAAKVAVRPLPARASAAMHVARPAQRPQRPIASGQDCIVYFRCRCFEPVGEVRMQMLTSSIYFTAPNSSSTWENGKTSNYSSDFFVMSDPSIWTEEPAGRLERRRPEIGDLQGLSGRGSPTTSSNFVKLLPFLRISRSFQARIVSAAAHDVTCVVLHGLTEFEVIVVSPIALYT